MVLTARASDHRQRYIYIGSVSYSYYFINLRTPFFLDYVVKAGDLRYDYDIEAT